MIIDHTYFKGELYLPNLKLNDSVGHASNALQTVGENDLSWYMEKYEREFLIRLLGTSLYKSFIDGLNEATPLRIWLDLRDAMTIQTDNYKLSPIANYVYFFVSRRGRTQTGIQGESRGTMSYAEIAEDSDKLTKAWNDMCDMITSFYCDFLNVNWDNYKSYSNGCSGYYRNGFRKINKFGI